VIREGLQLCALAGRNRMQRLRPFPPGSQRRFRAPARLAALAGASLALAIGCAAPPDLAPASSTTAVTVPAPALAGVKRTRITLITGDRVHVIERPGMAPTTAIEPAPGRGAVAFATTTGRFGRPGDVFVVPSDAEPLIAARRLDPRLFDVSELLRDGYDDARRAELPLIVTYAQPGAHRRALAPSGTRTVRPLASVNGAALAANKDDATRFWRTISSMSCAGVSA